MGSDALHMHMRTHVHGGTLCTVFDSMIDVSDPSYTTRYKLTSRIPGVEGLDSVHVIEGSLLHLMKPLQKVLLTDDRTGATSITVPNNAWGNSDTLTYNAWPYYSTCTFRYVPVLALGSVTSNTHAICVRSRARLE